MVVNILSICDPWESSITLTCSDEKQLGHHFSVGKYIFILAIFLNNKRLELEYNQTYTSGNESIFMRGIFVNIAR